MITKFIGLIFVVFFLFMSSSCAHTSAVHYRIPPEKSWSVGLGLKTYQLDNELEWTSMVHIKTRISDNNEWYIDASLPWVGSKGGTSSGWVETGFLYYIQSAARDGTSLRLAIPVRITSGGILPDLVFGAHHVGLFQNFLWNGGVSSSLVQLFFSSEDLNTMNNNRPENAQKPLPFNLEAGIGYQDLSGGGVLQFLFSGPFLSLSTEGFYLP